MRRSQSIRCSSVRWALSMTPLVLTLPPLLAVSSIAYVKPVHNRRDRGCHVTADLTFRAGEQPRDVGAMHDPQQHREQEEELSTWNASIRIVCVAMGSISVGLAPRAPREERHAERAPSAA